ncbi:MAG: hypothetical protein U0939_06045 [Pirellulales bacterium]
MAIPRKFLRQMGEFVRRPGVQFTVACILIAASGFEIIESFDEDLEKFRVGIHHGLFIVGIMNALAAVPDMVEGLERLEEIRDEKLAEKGPHSPD